MVNHNQNLVIFESTDIDSNIDFSLSAEYEGISNRINIQVVCNIPTPTPTSTPTQTPTITNTPAIKQILLCPTERDEKGKR